MRGERASGELEGRRDDKTEVEHETKLLFLFNLFFFIIISFLEAFARSRRMYNFLYSSLAQLFFPVPTIFHFHFRRFDHIRIEWNN